VAPLAAYAVKIRNIHQLLGLSGGSVLVAREPVSVASGRALFAD
jgi:hypothetical protein